MSLHRSINTLNGGEVSPDVHGRWDQEAYDSWLDTMNGFIPHVTGKAEMMTGFKNIGDQSTSATKARIIKFEFTSSDTFAIEFGHLYFQVWSTGTTPAIVDTGVHTYTESELDEIQVKPLNDQLYLTHKNHLPSVVTRVTDTNWTITDIPQDGPPTIEQNTDTTKTLSVSAVTGTSKTMTATGHTPFTSDHVGSYWLIKQWREAQAADPLNIATTTGTTTTSSIKVDGSWSLETSGFWWGEIKVEESETNAFAGEERTIYTRKSKSDANVNVSNDTASDVWIRLSYTSAGDPYGAGAGDPWDAITGSPSPVPAIPAIVPATAKLSSGRSLSSGIVKVTAFGNSSSVTVDVIEDLEDTNASWRWSEGAWSDHQGFPTSMLVFEQRLILGGTLLSPTTMWYTEVDNIGTWSPLGVEASDPMRTTISQDQNRILWMEGGKRILVGTGQNEYAITSSNAEAAITPTNITVKKQSSNGSKPISALTLGDAILHVARDGVTIQALNFELVKEGFKDSDMSRLAKHIFGNGIKQWAYQQNPNRTIYILTEEGWLVGFVFNRQDNVVAFFRRELEGTDIFESVETIRKDGRYDQVWVTVNRAGVRTIERLSDPTSDIVQMSYADGFVEYLTLGSASVTGLPTYMYNREVIIWNDGGHEEPRTVSGTGTLTLDNASATRLMIGFQYPKEGVLVPIEAPAGDGASRGKNKELSQLSIGTIDSLTGYAGYKYVDDDYIAAETEPQLMFPADSESFDGSNLPLTSRVWRETMPKGNYRDIRPYFRGYGAAPLNVTFIIARVLPKGD